MECNIHSNIFDDDTYCHLCKEVLETCIDTRRRQLERKQSRLESLEDTLRTFKGPHKKLMRLKQTVKEAL